MPTKLAIDFGTTNSVVARWDEKTQQPEVLALPGISLPPGKGRQPLIPSLLYVLDGRIARVAAGHSVIASGFEQHTTNRLFRSFKRGITAGPAPDARLIDGAPWSDQDAGEHFLHCLLEALPNTSQEIEQLVVTVPVAAFEGYSAWLTHAMQNLPAERIRVVDESTAAALGYAVTEPGAIVLVVDFGGGSLDLSLVQLPEGREKTGSLLGRLSAKDAKRSAARVLAKAGLSLGGSDIDQWLLAEVLKRCLLNQHELGNQYAALLATCETAKIALSADETTSLTFLTADGQSHTLLLRRTELEDLMEKHGFFTALGQVVDRVMRTAHQRRVVKEDVKYVLLVGGTALIPSVQKLLQDYFRDTPVRVDKPFTAVAEGALQVAVGFGLRDYLAHSFGLRYLDPQSGEPRYDEILPMGTIYPTERPVRLTLCAAHPDQAEIEFIVGQIANEALSMVEVKYEDGQAVFVAQADQRAQRIIPLNADLGQAQRVPLNPPGVPGLERLRAEFSIDHQRQLRLTVIDLKTGKHLLQDSLLASLSQAVSSGAGTAEKAGTHVLFSYTQLEQPAAPQAAETTAQAAALSGRAEGEAAAITGREPQLATPPPAAKKLTLRGLAHALAQLSPDAVSLEALSAALHSSDFVVRYSAAEMLAQRGDRDARLVLQEALVNAPAPARASLARQLHLFSWYSAEPFYRQAFKDPDDRVHESATYSLCQLRGQQAYNLLVELLPDESDNVRLAAAWGLSLVPDAGAIPVLAIAAQSGDAEVRAKALESLGATESTQALPVVRSYLADSDPEVVYSAALSLVELGREDSLSELAERICQASGETRLQLLRGLFHATNYCQVDVGAARAALQVIDALQIARSDPDPAIRLAAVMPLAWTRHPVAEQALRQAYHVEPDGETKARILRAAVHLMSPAGKELLANGLVDPNPAVHEAAEFLAQTSSHKGQFSGNMN